MTAISPDSAPHDTRRIGLNKGEKEKKEKRKKSINEVKDVAHDTHRSSIGLQKEKKKKKSKDVARRMIIGFRLGLGFGFRI